MSASYNKITLIGNLGKDPEITTFESGARKASFTLATSEKFKNKSGEIAVETTWHTITVWGKLVDVIEKYLKKGSRVLVAGPQKHRQFEDKNGNTKYFPEVEAKEMVMLGSKPEPGTTGGGEHHENHEPELNVGDDDLPF